MNPIDWLRHHRFVDLERREYDWVLSFDGNAWIVASCLWRLIDDKCIQVTSEDHRHQFGLPAPMDAVDYVNTRLANALVTDVDLRDVTLDLRITFDTGYSFEILPTSCGYESWEIGGNNQQCIARGGGNLIIHKDDG